MSEPRTIDRLIFVFAANSGLLSAAVDSAKKVLRLRGCSLCSITHGLAGEKREWSECREEIGVPVLQVHGTLDASIPIEARRCGASFLRAWPFESLVTSFPGRALRTEFGRGQRHVSIRIIGASTCLRVIFSNLRARSRLQKPLPEFRARCFRDRKFGR